MAEEECPPSNGFTSTAIRQTDTSEAANQDTGIQGVDDGRARLGNMESLEAREELEKQLNELSKSKVLITLLSLVIWSTFRVFLAGLFSNLLTTNR